MQLKTGVVFFSFLFLFQNKEDFNLKSNSEKKPLSGGKLSKPLKMHDNAITAGGLLSVFMSSQLAKN